MYDEEIPNETTLRAMREVDMILAAWEKFHAESIIDDEVIDMAQPAYAEPAHEQSAKKLYDDYGNVVTNAATLRALAESEEIIAAWNNMMMED